MDTVSFTDSELSLLREAVGDVLSEKRFSHTVSVEREATFLGEHLLPNQVNELRAAALLHDIAKEIGREEQILLVECSDDPKCHEPCPLPALHSFAGAELIKRKYPNFATKSIIKAVMYHTLGDGDMTLFETIIYCSDYIEETRMHRDAERIRCYLHEGLESASSYNDKLKCFYLSVLDVISCTLAHLSSLGISPDTRTLAAERAIRSLI